MAKKQKRRDVRKLMSKSVNVFHGRKSEDYPTYTESPLEADLCYHLEFDKNVVSYQAQPFPITYFFDGKLRSYTPDFKVTYQNGSVVYIEVKYEADKTRIDNFEQWIEAINQSLISQGSRVIVITELFIRKQPTYENLVNVYSATRLKLDKAFLVKIITAFESKKNLTIAELITQDKREYELEQIHRLIFERKLIAPINIEIISTSSVIQHSGESYECYI
ncbi:TnsA endonuclease N-terminal domain-containing protein [Parashewanella tropica]|uniref:TnsA endonuclease N-terminal domain-containing protein n=1 Tax=Parashewanella tropica TaxID=2547970 RepID=UPI0010597535|nr:TnsA endonuclease N-terminal domain-containing protein [Parashewanella tropica]